MSKKVGKSSVALSDIILKKTPTKQEKTFLTALPQRIMEFVGSEMNSLQNKVAKFKEFTQKVIVHMEGFPEITDQDLKDRFFQVLSTWYINFTDVLVDWQLLRFGSVISDFQLEAHHDFVIRNNRETRWNDSKLSPTDKALRFVGYKLVEDYSAASQYGFNELVSILSKKEVRYLLSLFWCCNACLSLFCRVISN